MASLLTLQSGAISRRQAREAGLGEHDLRRLLRRHELVRVHAGVYVAHTGELTPLQHWWCAVLYAWPAALCGESALRAAESSGGRAVVPPVHVAVAGDRHLVSPRGMRLHRMTGFENRTLWNSSPPGLRYEEAALDVAAAAPDDFRDLAEVARACQSRKTTAARMIASLGSRSRTPRGRWLRAVLTDIAVIELDGRLFHDTARQRDHDMDRDLDAAVAGEATIRIGYGQVFDRPCVTAARVSALLHRHGWRGDPRPCRPDCVVRRPAAMR